MTSNKRWLNSPLFDSLFILFPPFLILLLIILFPVYFQAENDVKPIHWLLLIVFIDVAHVYSTLFRTYFVSDARREFKSELLIIPILVYFICVLMYSIDNMLFWRVLAYTAVFHFIRQQYGFVMLYSRNEIQLTIQKNLDKLMIYSATIYPIIHWHLAGPKNFNWFIEGDFFYFNNTVLDNIFFAMYSCIISVYCIKEVSILIKEKRVNIQKNIIVIGTILSWYIGIVYFNGDLIFTALNVVAHGIPYMALVWTFYYKKNKASKASDVQFNFTSLFKNLLIFIVVVFLFAYIEEGLWDLFIWQEHMQFFGNFRIIKIESHSILSFVIPLLTLPQAVHYILDAFIWKLRTKSEWVATTLK